MKKYKSPLVSCIHCREVKSSAGIHTHYIICHTEDGKKKNSEKLARASETAKIVNISNHITVVQKYENNPAKCQCCGSLLTYQQRKNIFCSQSCVARATNPMKPPISEETKQKISAKLIGKPTKPLYSKVSFCEICDNTIMFRHSKTCSKKCTNALISRKASERIKESSRCNYPGGKPSYLELSFEKWLKENNFGHIWYPEYTIHNHITNKWYFVDFYFPSLNLIVELDGKQHETPEHKEKDRIRDQYITTHKGINVMRISYEEYIRKTKMSDLVEILNQTS